MSAQNALREIVEDDAVNPPVATGPMFASYGGEGDARGARQWFAALTTSSVVYLLIGVLALVVGTATKQAVQEKKVDVTFVERVVKEAPPPPPPAPEVKPQPPPAA